MDEVREDEAINKVVEAVEGALQEPISSPQSECLRCGHKWTPKVVNPRVCPMCRSAYWDRPPQTARARRPNPAALVRLRKARSKDKRRYRKLKRLKSLAKELGVDLADPRTGKLPDNFADEWTTGEVVVGTVVPTVTVNLQSPVRRTVPPPPGIEDL